MGYANHWHCLFEGLPFVCIDPNSYFESPLGDLSLLKRDQLTWGSSLVQLSLHSLGYYKVELLPPTAKEKGNLISSLGKMWRHERCFFRGLPPQHGDSWPASTWFSAFSLCKTDCIRTSGHGTQDYPKGLIQPYSLLETSQIQSQVWGVN